MTVTGSPREKPLRVDGGEAAMGVAMAEGMMADMAIRDWRMEEKCILSVAEE